MSQSLRLVLDIGKTASKLSAWTGQGRCVARFGHANGTVDAGAYRALDVTAIEAWLADSLRQVVALGTVSTIIPVAHGATAAIIRDGRLATPVMDYEFAIPADMAAEYAARRDDSAVTGSPLMPLGFNLGCQFHYLQALDPSLFAGDAEILPWAQYWTWRLSGRAVAEVSSLGAHSDLWMPGGQRPSPMAVRRGWADRFARFLHAGDVAGQLSPEWQARCGLGPEVAVHVGLHDSNAALHAARGRSLFAAGDATMLSTGTWFVTMRSPGEGREADLSALAYDRGCLVNVDIDARPVPTALFMGGREFETLVLRLGISADDPALAKDLEAAAAECLRSGRMVLPGWQPGTGQFPGRAGVWLNRPDGQPAVLVAASLLYLALLADTALDLVGARRMLVIDGRFANNPVFTGVLAALRPDLEVYVADAEHDVALGALRAADPGFPVGQNLHRVAPMAGEVLHYRERWRESVAA